MSWGYYRGCVIYGFEELQEKIIHPTILQEAGLSQYYKYAEKGGCYHIMYGIEVRMGKDGKIVPDERPKIVVNTFVNKYNFPEPGFYCALQGGDCEYELYTPK